MKCISEDNFGSVSTNCTSGQRRFYGIGPSENKVQNIRVNILTHRLGVVQFGRNGYRRLLPYLQWRMGQQQGDSVFPFSLLDFGHLPT